MKIIAFLLLTYIEETKGTKYQSGYSSTWAGSYAAGTTQDQTITFPSQFLSVPQISINPLIVSESHDGQAHSGYQISVSSITTSSFKVTLAIPSNTNTIGFVTFYWIAIDDSRFEILQNFNEANPQSKTLSHSKPKATKGIIFLTSFHGSTKFDFTLSLGTITSTTVQVNVYQQNMISLGYIVILGPSECFDIETQIIQLPKDQYATDVYISRQVTKETDKIWFFFLQYFTYDLSYAFRIQLQPWFSASTSQYKYCTWSDSPSGISQQDFSQCAHQCATLKFPTVGPNSMLFKKVRISSLILQAQTEDFQFSIQDIDFTYTPVIDNQKIVVPKNLESLTFQINVKCSQNYKVTASFYQCPSCSSIYKTIIRKCYHSLITLKYFITYIVQDTDYEQNLVINMVKTQLKILQTVNNQEVLTDLLIGQINFE